MVETWEIIGKIRNTIVIRATAQAESLALRIPKEILEIYNILPGDAIRVQLEEHYRKKREPENEQKLKDSF